jgi:hypothetical protein
MRYEDPTSDVRTSRPTARPVVADRNKSKARLNIATKLEILTSILEPSSSSARGESLAARLLQSDSVPTSIRQFNSWSSASLIDRLRAELPRFEPNANATLNGHPALLEAVRSAIEGIRSLSRKRRVVSYDERVTSLKRALSTANQKCSILEAELASAWTSNRELKAEVDRLGRRYAALQREFQVCSANAGPPQCGEKPAKAQRSGKVIPLTRANDV